MQEVQLDTWNKCVNSFKQADRVMGSAFRQKLEAFGKAREIYINNNGKERGFITKFAEDCGITSAYASMINTVSESKEKLNAFKFSELGANTLSALANAPDAVVEAAAEIVERGEKLVTKDVKRLQESYEDHTEEQYKELAAAMPDIDWSLLPAFERGDTTTGSQELACTGGVCEVVGSGA